MGEDDASKLLIPAAANNEFTGSVSTPTVGVFTGHRHGEKGGKLTFGKNTYHNVFSDVPDTLDGCYPGTFGQTHADCKECPQNSWCPGDQRAIACPANCMSFPGSYAPEQCQCKPGWYGPRDGCQPCLADSYCPGGETINVCPPHSLAETEQWQCQCAPGFWSEDGDHAKCAPCPEGSFCPGNNARESCPDKSTSPVGSTAAHQCICKAGFFEPQDRAAEDAAPECVPCAAGTFCPGGDVASPCPENSVSGPGAAMVEECACTAGFFGTAGTCAACPANSYCEGGEQPTACPPDTESAAGLASLFGCKCIPGFFADPSLPAPGCLACPADFKCAGDTDKTPCPAQTTSEGGATQCTCVPGLFGPEEDCAPCNAGQYCIGNGLESTCPTGTVGDAGAKSLAECKCDVGYFGSGGYDCHPCEEGDVCPGDGEKKPCPHGAHSPAKATDLAQCLCSASLVSENGQCRVCREGFFCPGANQELACPEGSTSDPGTSDAEDCKCLPGYSFGASDKCEKCTAGFYCPGGWGKPKECPHAAASDPGAQSVDDCVCPKGSYGSGEKGCATCPVGSKCPGQGLKVSCPAGTTSHEGAIECICDKGYFGEGEECNLCPAGSFCDGGGDSTSCGEATKSAPGSISKQDCECDTQPNWHSNYRVEKTYGNAVGCSMYDCVDNANHCLAFNQCGDDPLCQGFYAPEGSIFGKVCKLRGTSDCTSKRQNTATPLPEGTGTVYVLKKPRCDQCIVMGGDSFSEAKSLDGWTSFVLQGDGNLVLTGSYKWESHTAGSGADRAQLTQSGNLVLLAGGQVVWQSNSNIDGKRGPPYLEVQDDGNVVIYSADKQVVWATGTAS